MDPSYEGFSKKPRVKSEVGVRPLLGVGDKSALIYHGQFGS